MSTGADLTGRERHIPNDNMTQEQSFKKGFCSLRHGLAFILHLCNFSIYTQQMNLSIAITAMVNTTVASSQLNASTGRPPTDSQVVWNETLQESKAPVYDWTPEIQGILLSSLNYGSFLAPLSTGYVAGVFGAKYVVGLGLLISSVLTLFIPLAADTGVALLIALRVIQGMAQVMVLTGQYSIWAKWAPPLERSQLITIAASGSMLGTFLVLIAGGLLCQALGWPYIFYIFVDGDQGQQQEDKSQMENQHLSKKVPGFCSFRYGLAILLHFCNIAVMAQRVCLNLTMVAMVNNTEPPHLSNGSVVEVMDNVKSPVYSWSLDIQGLILSSVLFGMVVVQAPVGYLSGIYPMKRIIGSSLFLSSVMSLLIPSAAEVGAALVIVCRVLQGIAQGTVSTGQHEIWVKWAPPLERGRLTSITLSGFSMGPFIVLLVSGFICDLLGWPMVFYIFGIVGCVLSLIWFILFFDDPKNHPYMSSSEKDYIISSLVQQVSSRRQSLPIKAMLKSLPLWAIILTSFAFIWSNSLLVTYTPTFISTVLHVNVRENGLLSSLPYLLAYICGIVAGQISDFFLSRKIFSVVTVRKLFTTLGIFCPVVFIMCLLYLSYNFYSTIIFLTLANSTLTFSFCGQYINALDIAPRYYGFLKAVTGLIGIFGGLISSTITGLILNQDPDYAWHKVFFLMAGINVTCLAFYLLFAKGEIQDWAKETKTTRL